MGKSAQSAANTRKNIVSTAVLEFRRRGFDNVGLADLMSRLGLTHGGFYRHFSSKDQLIIEACGEAFNFSWPEDLPKHSREGLRVLVSKYLPISCKENPAETCAFAVLGSDIARSSEQTRSVATTGFKDFVMRKDCRKWQASNPGAKQTISSVR